jgi:hypothetical protein
MRVSGSEGMLREKLLDSISTDAVEATCTRCGIAEWVIPLDTPLDTVFLANYHCADCD